MRRRFFVDRFDSATATLRGDSAHHLVRVLRAQPGQLYELSDGASLWLARIARVSKSSVGFALVEQLPVTADPLHLTLLLSIVKFDRFEWALEKATELGVAEIVPLAAARSEKALLSAAAKRATRWQEILLESAQQSRRLRPPVLHPVARPADALSSVNACLLSYETPAEKYARENPDSLPEVIQKVYENRPFDSAHPDDYFETIGFRRPCGFFLSERPEALALKQVLSTHRPRHAALAIGPEGGWTDDEFSAARTSEFHEVSLGPTILRTETAVIAAVSSLRYALTL